MSRVDCYWCSESYLTEVGRIIHLRREHPEFFARYDEINGWNPLGGHNIPEEPSGGGE